MNNTYLYIAPSKKNQRKRSTKTLVDNAFAFKISASIQLIRFDVCKDMKPFHFN